MVSTMTTWTEPARKLYCKSCSDFDSVLILPTGARRCPSCGGTSLGDLDVLEKAHVLVSHVVQRQHENFVRDVAVMNFLREESKRRG